MRIAVLMHGLAGTVDKYNTGTPLPINLSHDHFKKHILNVNENVDVFMLCWTTESEEQLVKLYNPVSHMFEPQITFDFEYIVGNPDGPGGESDTWVDGKFRGLDNLRFHSMFSKWYSAKVANELKKKYEEENGFEYDFVLFTRYDLAYLVDFYFPEMNNELVYLPGPDGWNPEKGMYHGVHDLWVISNSKYIDHICDHMFDFLRTIDRFPGKFTHNHFWLRHLLDKSGLLNVVQFVGPDRPWDSGVAGRTTGQSPPVRDWYGLSEATPNSDMSKERNKIRAISEKIIRNSPNGGIEVAEISKDED